MSNLEIIGVKKFLGLPNWTRPTASSNFGCPQNFSHLIISKLDSIYSYYIYKTSVFSSFIFSQTGMIRTRDDTFYIRPLPLRLAKKDDFEGQPHVIYRGPIDNLSSDYLMSGILTTFNIFAFNTKWVYIFYIPRVKQQGMPTLQLRFDLLYFFL